MVRRFSNSICNQCLDLEPDWPPNFMGPSKIKPCFPNQMALYHRKLWVPIILATSTGGFLSGEEVSRKWNVELPAPPPIESRPSEQPVSQPISSTVLASHTERREVTQAAPMQGLPPVRGNVNVSVKLVEDPKLPEPPPTLPSLPPDDPAVVARLAEARKNFQSTEIAFVSVTVYDHSRSLVRIHPNGKEDKTVTAWSNVNFSHFCGFSGWRVNHPDGTSHDVRLLFGVSRESIAQQQAMAERGGRDYTPPVIPELPDLAAAGPAFVVIDGPTESSAMSLLEQSHELYRKEGARMEQAWKNAEAETEARRAHFLSNPPHPKDVSLKFWKRNSLPSNP